MKNPKVFISYSWSSKSHCDCIRSYAERLINDGVDVILDQWVLSEGQDKYAFMEKMVTDNDVTHVLIFSDQQYANKADSRESGVGTESQIISKEIYDKVSQNKFIPIICEKNENGEPYLPVFLRSRIWIDFSSPEVANDNWEKLLRLLYNKPMHEKPLLGKPPSFLSSTETRPSLPTIGKFNTLRDALLNSKPTINFCRKDFIDSVIEFIDSSRIRKAPEVEHRDEKVIEDLHKLLPIRDQVIDWFLIESSFAQLPKFDSMLIDFLERLLSLKYRPEEVTRWETWWYDAQNIFIYEIFLYFIAVLIKEDRFESLKNIFTTRFLLHDSEVRSGNEFVDYSNFYGYSEALNGYRKKRLNLNRISVVADIVKDRATRNDIKFDDLMQAELLLVLVSLLSVNYLWYPNIIIYADYRRFPFFIRSAQHKYFRKIAIVTGAETGDILRARFTEGCERHAVKSWQVLFYAHISLPNLMNMKELDTIN